MAQVSVLRLGAFYTILHREARRQDFFTRDAWGVYVPMDTADGVVRSRVLPFW